MTELQGSATTATGSAIGVVESFFEALRAFDVARAMSFLDDRIVYQNYPFPPARGTAQVERTLRAFARVATMFDVRMHHIAERDGIVLTERTDIIRGPALDLEFWCCGTFEVRDGKIVLWRDRSAQGSRRDACPQTRARSEHVEAGTTISGCRSRGFGVA
jgi:limonene-1,2-epoxide hydrolase